MELLALPLRDQHVSGPAQTSVSERKDPHLPPTPARPGPQAVVKRGDTPVCRLDEVLVAQTCCCGTGKAQLKRQWNPQAMGT